MPKPLDRAELEKAADAAVYSLTLGDVGAGKSQPFTRSIILTALTNIAKRAFEQAARPTWVGGRVLGDPPMVLSDVLAALKAPENDTGKKVDKVAEG